MDPDKALADLIEALDQLDHIEFESPGSPDEDYWVDSLRASADALNCWLSRGGYLPQRWSRSKP